MTELTDSFKPVDLEAYQLALGAIPLISRRLSEARTTNRPFRDTDEKRIETTEDWLAAVYAGKWPGVRPFDNGTQFADWQASNCQRCIREATADQNKPPVCPILYAVSKASIGYGVVSEEIARRMGYQEGPPFAYVWECAEVEWTEQWQAEKLVKCILSYAAALPTGLTDRKALDKYARERIELTEALAVGDTMGAWLEAGDCAYYAIKAAHNRLASEAHRDWLIADAAGAVGLTPVGVLRIAAAKYELRAQPGNPKDDMAERAAVEAVMGEATRVITITMG